MTFARPPVPLGGKPPPAGHFVATDIEVFGTAAPAGPADEQAPCPSRAPFADHFLGACLGNPQRQTVHLPRPWQLASRPLFATVLVQGSSGESVRRLQQLLNARLEPSPGLLEDGQFGDKTRTAVVALQNAQVIDANGKVEKETWFNLLFRGKVKLPNQASAGAQNLRQPAAPHAAVLTSGRQIASWLLKDKFEAVLSNTSAKLPGDLRFVFGKVLAPSSRKIMASTLVNWAISQYFSGRESVDCGMLLVSLGLPSEAAFEAAADLHSFLDFTVTALDQRQLDAAAQHLARAIAVTGVTLFMNLMERVLIKPQTKVAKPPAAGPSPTSPKGAGRVSNLGRAENKALPATAPPAKTLNKADPTAVPHKPIEKPSTQKADALKAARRAAIPFSEIC